MPAVAALSAGFHADTGQDSAGVMFGRQYAEAADAVLAAVAAGINACAQTGSGVQASAVTYSRAEAMSDIFGRAQPLGSPPCPVPVSAPAGPSVTGAGVGEPLLWAVVAMLVGDLWPSGSPAWMRAAAGAWRAFGTVLEGVSGELAGPSAVGGAQQIPEAEQIVSVLQGIGSDFAAIGAEWQRLPGFIAAVGAACLAFNLLSIGVGYGLPRLLRLPRSQSIAISMEIGIHNGTLAIFIALNVLQNAQMSIPAAVYSIIMFFTAGAFAYGLNLRKK
jgi:hypothetical protein